MAIERLEDHQAWQVAHGLVLEIYRITRTFPSEEKFGLVSQVRRAAVSVPANIAEGFKRRGQKDKLHFYVMSQGSLEESRYYCILGTDLGYIGQSDSEVLMNRIEETSKLLTGLTRVMRARS